MSVADGEGQLDAHEEHAAPRRRIPKGYRVAVVGLAVLAVVITVIIAGMMDPFPKRKILKANEMSEVTDLEGHWEQTSLHCFDDDAAPPYSSQQAAQSIMSFDNGTAHLTVAITVVEMASPEKANATYKGWEGAWEEVGTVEAGVDLGDEGMFSGFLNTEGDYDGSAYVHFRKGCYLVEMYFDGTVPLSELLSQIAGEQAARL